MRLHPGPVFCRIARVSAPSLGAGCWASPAYPKSFTGGSVMREVPALGNISRAADCGSFTTSSRLRTGEQGMPKSAKIFAHSAQVLDRRVCSRIGSSTLRFATRRRVGGVIGMVGQIRTVQRGQKIFQSFWLATAMTISAVPGRVSAIGDDSREARTQGLRHYTGAEVERIIRGHGGDHSVLHRNVDELADARPMAGFKRQLDADDGEHSGVDIADGVAGADPLPPSTPVMEIRPLEACTIRSMAVSSRAGRLAVSRKSRSK